VRLEDANEVRRQKPEFGIVAANKACNDEISIEVKARVVHRIFGVSLHLDLVSSLACVVTFRDILGSYCCIVAMPAHFVPSTVSPLRAQLLVDATFREAQHSIALALFLLHIVIIVNIISYVFDVVS
jgi:hypothetical protein